MAKKTASKKPTRKKAVDKVTYVALVLDRSGSMQSIRTQAVDGINQQFDQIRKAKKSSGKIEVTLFQFDDVIEPVFENVTKDQLREWGYDEFQPRNSTALNDAILRAITHLQSRPRAENTAYLVHVISDGWENASKEISEAELRALIETLNATDEWTFSYHLGNRTVEQERAFANSMAVNESNIMVMNNNASSYTYANTVTANSVGSYYGMRSSGATKGAGLYDQASKTDARSLK